MLNCFLSSSGGMAARLIKPRWGLSWTICGISADVIEPGFSLALPVTAEYKKRPEGEKQRVIVHFEWSDHGCKFEGLN